MDQRLLRSWDWYRVVISASCPPDTKIQMRGGWLADSPAAGPTFGGIWWVGPDTYDLADPGVCENSHAFTAPYYYTYAALSLNQGLRPGFVGNPIYLTWAGTEWSLSSNAEDAAMADGAQSVPAWSRGAWLGLIIFRNNGVVGVPNAILPIEPINRGRSYIFKSRTMEPRHEL